MLKVKTIVITCLTVVLLALFTNGADTIKNGLETEEPPVGNIIITTTTTTTVSKVTTTTILKFGLNDFQEEIYLKNKVLIDRINPKNLKITQYENEKFQIIASSNMTFTSPKKWIQYEAGTIDHICKNECTINEYTICDKIICVDYSPINLEGKFDKDLVSIEKINNTYYKIVHGAGYDPTINLSTGMIMNISMDDSGSLTYTDTFAEDATGSFDGTGTNTVYNENGGHDGVGDYIFNGINTQMDFGDSDLFSPLTTTNISFSIRVNESNLDNKMFISKAGGGQWEYYIRITANRFNFRLFQVAGSLHAELYSTTTITEGQFYHVVVTSDYLEDYRLYVNGQLEANKSAYTGVMTNTVQTLKLGHRGDGVNYFNGTIGKFEFYNKILTPEEILCLYDGTGCSDPENITITNTTYSVTDGHDECTTWRTDKDSVCNGTDGRPTVSFDTSVNASCSIRNQTHVYDPTYICEATNDFSHVCTISASDVLSGGTDINMYASCNATVGDSTIMSDVLKYNNTACIDGSTSTGNTTLTSCIKVVGTGCGAVITDNCAVIQ